MLSIETIEKELGCKLSPEKIQEIMSLEDHSDECRRANKIGQKFGRLLVIGYAPKMMFSGHSQGTYWCICSCPEHTILRVRNCNLTSGNTKSCGCWNIEASKARIIEVGHRGASDLTNEVFGDLTALYPTEERNNHSVVWVCRCSCGREVKASAKELRRGSVMSCGHNRDSKGVRKIKEVLNTNNIPYITEKAFPEFRFKDTNGLPRFDFYVDNKYLIEYDGEQHFEERNNGFFRESLQKRQEHDRIKNEWCKEHNIPLIRFSYKELDLISIEEINRRLSL